MKLRITDLLNAYHDEFVPLTPPEEIFPSRQGRSVHSAKPARHRAKKPLLVAASLILVCCAAFGLGLGFGQSPTGQSLSAAISSTETAPEAASQPEAFGVTPSPAPSPVPDKGIPPTPTPTPTPTPAVEAEEIPEAEPEPTPTPTPVPTPTPTPDTSIQPPQPPSITTAEEAYDPADYERPVAGSDPDGDGVFTAPLDISFCVEVGTDAVPGVLDGMLHAFTVEADTGKTTWYVASEQFSLMIAAYGSLEEALGQQEFTARFSDYDTYLVEQFFQDSVLIFDDGTSLPVGQYGGLLGYEDGHLTVTQHLYRLAELAGIEIDGLIPVQLSLAGTVINLE